MVTLRTTNSHKVPIVKNATWVETIPFEVFTNDITILYGFEVNSELGKEKSSILKKQVEAFFKEVMDEGFKSLEEESTCLIFYLHDYNVYLDKTELR